MIILVPLNGAPTESFENYDELFECIIGYENEKYPDAALMDWNFAVYPPKEVGTLYALSHKPCAAIEEAFEEGVPLIEVCAGDYKNPLYIVATPNVDMDYLKRKWCIDYGTYHDLVVKEF